ncbi:Protein of unknown function DUF262 [Hymenobacter mucosus]|uniref:Uncharacterized protein n=2 Tax=Hymenobacter mucosus TaxID=1411120 RepID=A0A238X3D5_9BACT|nr:Protein of unknown function DUF262 [Hymenobacter mucosus]
MAKLTKSKLVEVFVNTIQSEGAVVEYRTPRGEHPAVLYIRAQGLESTYRVYIWNLSRGGARRPADEYRIQTSGVSSFECKPGEITLILGYWAELELFVAFDYSKHTGALGNSVSLQIREKPLHDAVIDGISIYHKESSELVIVFGKERALTYLKHYEAIHSGEYRYEATDQRNYIDLLEDETSPRRYSLTSYGADYSVKSIVQQISAKLIYVPDFQRQFVWSREEASRFVESLLLGFPVPGIFLAHDTNGKLLIVDGQQRLLSLYYFIIGVLRGEKFGLQGVASDLEGKTYDTLSYDDKSRLDNQIIHATIVKSDDPTDERESIYLIFERLNTGGTKLTSQEIRTSMYYGKFNDYLNAAVTHEAWSNIFGFANDRAKSQELILRFLAFYYNRSSYEPPMMRFLNEFMSSNRNLEQHSKEEMDALLLPALSIIGAALERRAFRLGGGINAAVFDSVMVALATRLQTDHINPGQAREAYNRLLLDESYLIAVRTSTAHKAAVETRIQTAIDYFGQDIYSPTLL